MQHVIIGSAGALMILVVLARAVELCELCIEFVVIGSRARRYGAVSGIISVRTA
jgi:hypothetical protein